MERKRHSRILQRERVRPQRLRVEPPPGVAGVDGALLALKIFTDQVKSLVDDAERILNDVACNQARVLNVTPCISGRGAWRGQHDPGKFVEDEQRSGRAHMTDTVLSMRDFTLSRVAR